MSAENLGGPDSPPADRQPVPSGLEVAYRGLLLCYPRRWREARGDELIGTLLDGADAAGRSRPTVAEVVDLVGHGLHTRFRAGVGAVPAGVRGAVRTLALAVGTGLAVICLAVAERQPPAAARLPAWPTRPPEWADRGIGPFLTSGPLVFVPWLVAFVAAVAGRWWIARVALAATLPATGAVLVLGARTGLLRPPLHLLLVLAVLAAVAMTGPPETRGGRRAAHLGGLPVATGAVLGWAVLLGAFGYRFGWWRAPEDGFLATLRLTHSGYWSGSYYWSLAESVPQVLLAGGLLGMVVGVRRPGWLAAVFACGVVLSTLPLLRAWVDRWDFYQTSVQVTLILAVLLSGALVDAWRAHRRRPPPRPSVRAS